MKSKPSSVVSFQRHQVEGSGHQSSLDQLGNTQERQSGSYSVKLKRALKYESKLLKSEKEIHMNACRNNVFKIVGNMERPAAKLRINLPSNAANSKITESSQIKIINKVGISTLILNFTSIHDSRIREKLLRETLDSRLLSGINQLELVWDDSMPALTRDAMSYIVKNAHKVRDVIHLENATITSRQLARLLGAFKHLENIIVSRCKIEIQSGFSFEGLLKNAKIKNLTFKDNRDSSTR